MLGPGNLDVGDPPLDKAKGDDPVFDILIRDGRTGVDKTPIDVQQCETPADLLEIRDRDGLTQIGRHDVADRLLVEDGVALDPDVTEDESGRLAERPGSRLLRYRQFRAEPRRRTRRNLRQPRNGAAGPSAPPGGRFERWESTRLG